MTKGSRSFSVVRGWQLLVLLCLVAACDALNDPPTRTPTRTPSGPDLIPTATTALITSDDMDIVFSGRSDPTAAAAPRDGELPPVPVTTPIPGTQAQVMQITLTDGALVQADVYQTGTARVPGVLLLGIDRAAWGDFPLRLQSIGFSAMVTDLRQPFNTTDFDVVLRAFSGLGAVDPGRIAVIGAESGADLALLGCAVDWLCDVTVLLSPVSQGTLLNVLPNYNPRPIMLVASQDDPQSYETALALSQAARGKVLFQPLTNAGRGTQMLQSDPTLGDTIIDWLTRHLSG
jgi:hypothetical protein